MYSQISCYELISFCCHNFEFSVTRVEQEYNLYILFLSYLFLMVVLE